MAGNASGIRAGRAFVVLGVNDEEMKKGLDRVRARMKALSTDLASAGVNLAGMAATMAAPLALGAKAFAGFEKQMAMVNTLAPDSFMAGFTKGIQKMSVEFGESTDVLAKGLYDLLSSAIAPEQALGVLQKSVTAAKAGMTDTATATKVLTNVINAFGLSADDAGAVSDVLFQTVNRGVITFEELAQYLGSVTATAKAAGLSLPEVGAALATMTRQGLNADAAVTALNGILTNFLKPAAESTEAAKRLGINLSSAGLRANGLLGVFEKLKGASPDEIASVFGDVRAARGAFALSGDLAGLAKDLDLMGNAAGSTQAAFKKMANTLSADFEKTKQGMVRAATEIGLALSGEIKNGLQTIREYLMSAAQWLAENKALVLSYGKLTLAVAGVAGGLLVLGKFAGALVAITTVGKGAITTVAWLVKGFHALNAAGLLSASTIGTKMAAAVGALRGALTLLAAHPVVAVLAGIGIAAVGAAVALSRMDDYIANLSSRMRDLVAAGDKQRENDQLRLQRLQQLAKAGALDNAQMEEAKSLTSALADRYGSLGVVLDETAKSLTVAAGAMEALNKAQNAKALQETENAIAEQRNNIVELRKEMESAAGKGAGAFSTWGKSIISTVTFGQYGLTASDDYAKEAAGKFQAGYDELKRLMEKREALLAGDKGALTGNAQSQSDALRKRIAEGAIGVDAGAVETAKKVYDELRKLEQQAADKRLSTLDREIGEISKLAKDRTDAIQKLIDAMPTAKDDTLGAIVAGPQIAIMQQRMVQIQADAEAEITRLKQAEEQKRQQAAAETLSEQELYLLELQKQQLEAGDAEKQNKEAIAKLDADIYRKQQAQQIERLYAVNDAMTKAEQAAAEAGKQRALGVVESVAQAMESVKATADIKATVAGAFGASNVGDLGMSSATMERTARATESMERRLTHMDQILTNSKGIVVRA